MAETKQRKQTYEEYLESVKKDIYAEEGEYITCTKGHYLMTCAITTYVGNAILNGDFDKYDPCMRDDERLPGRCGHCSQWYVTFQTKSNIDYGNVRFFIDGEFRERKYK